MKTELITRDITPAVKLLQAGGLVAVPTETVYGLAGNGLDPGVIEKIYEAMEAEKSYTASDIQKLIPELAEAKIQKVTHLITAMRNRVLVSREVIKGKAYFTKI